MENIMFHGIFIQRVWRAKLPWTYVHRLLCLSAYLCGLVVSRQIHLFELEEVVLVGRPSLAMECRFVRRLSYELENFHGIKIVVERDEIR